MPIGHFVLGLAAKRVAPRTPLGLLLAAPFLLDLLFPIFVLLGWEQMQLLPDQQGFLILELVSMPYSHSGLAAVVWATLLALPYFIWRRDGRGAAVLALLVLSHWVFDALTHRPDMAVFLHEPKVGLGLWCSLPATVAVEGALFTLCVWLYVSATRPLNRAGRIGLAALVGLFVVVYLGFRPARCLVSSTDTGMRPSANANFSSLNWSAPSPNNSRVSGNS